MTALDTFSCSVGRPESSGGYVLGATAVRALLAHGADPNGIADAPPWRRWRSETGQGQSMLGYAVSRLCSISSIYPGAIDTCCDVVSALLQAGANPNPAPSEVLGVWHPLVTAADYGCQAFVQLLLAAGARSSTVNGHDALEHACDQGHVRIIHTLLASEHDRPTKQQQWRILLDSISGPLMGWRRNLDVAAVLLLHLHAWDDSAAAVLMTHGDHGGDPTALRMALLRGWAADTAWVGRERAALAASEGMAAAAQQGFGELFVGFAQQQQQQEQ